jgi:hypothetical protein
MASLKVGYDAFAGSSQAGTDSGVPGVIQVETAKAEKYFCRIQELDSNEYYNAATLAFQIADPGKAHHLVVTGSDAATIAAIRRLVLRIPAEAQAGIGAAGATFTIYADSDSAAAGAESITITFQP